MHLSDRSHKYLLFWRLHRYCQLHLLDVVEYDPNVLQAMILWIMRLMSCADAALSAVYARIDLLYMDMPGSNVIFCVVARFPTMITFFCSQHTYLFSMLLLLIYHIHIPTKTSQSVPTVRLNLRQAGRCSRHQKGRQQVQPPPGQNSVPLRFLLAASRCVRGVQDHRLSHAFGAAQGWKDL